MVGRNYIVKKNSPENFLPLQRNPHSVMTSLTLFSPNQNLVNDSVHF